MNLYDTSFEITQMNAIRLLDIFIYSRVFGVDISGSGVRNFRGDCKSVW